MSTVSQNLGQNITNNDATANRIAAGFRPKGPVTVQYNNTSSKTAAAAQEALAKLPPESTVNGFALCYQSPLGERCTMKLDPIFAVTALAIVKRFSTSN